MFTKLFKKNDVKIIENGNHQKIMKLLQSPRNSLSEKAQLALIQRGEPQEIKQLFISRTILCDDAQIALIKRNQDEDIQALLAYPSKLCEKAQNLIVQRNKPDEILNLIRFNIILKDTAEKIIESGSEKELLALINKDFIFSSKNVSQIINKGYHEPIIALIKKMKFRFYFSLLEENKEKIIFRDNPEEIDLLLKCNIFPNKTEFLHLIEQNNHDAVIQCLSIQDRKFSPLNEDIVHAIFQRGNNEEVTAMIRRGEGYPHWFEDELLKRGHSDEIVLFAYHHKVGSFMAKEILRRGNEKEINALVKNFDATSLVFDLIDNKEFKLLENYAKYMSKDPMFYMLIKALKKQIKALSF